MISSGIDLDFSQSTRNFFCLLIMISNYFLKARPLAAEYLLEADIDNSCPSGSLKKFDQAVELGLGLDWLYGKL